MNLAQSVNTLKMDQRLKSRASAKQDAPRACQPPDVYSSSETKHTRPPLVEFLIPFDAAPLLYVHKKICQSENTHRALTTKASAAASAPSVRQQIRNIMVRLEGQRNHKVDQERAGEAGGVG